MRPKGSEEELGGGWRWDRALLQEGMKPAEVARVVGMSRASVARWRQVYEADGKKALAAKLSLGASSRLTEAQRGRPVRMLLQGLPKTWVQHGALDAETGGQGNRSQLRMECYPSAVWQALRAMGWSCQRLERRARQRDELAV